MTVRLYRPDDRSSVRAIACETAARGEPVEEFFHDREIFADLVTRYHTDWEPASLWVAEHEGHVVGYVSGCLDHGRYRRIMARRIVPRAIARALGRGAASHVSVRRLLAGALKTWRLGGFRRRAYLDAYPAHLHVNLERAHRGRGLGDELVQRFIRQAAAASIRGVHAAVRGDNAPGCRFFERLGFREVDRIPVVFPSGTALHQRETVIYGRQI